MAKRQRTSEPSAIAVGHASVQTTYVPPEELRQRFPRAILDRFEVREWKHASAILATDFKNEFNDLISVLPKLRVPRSWVLEKGGRKTKIAQWIDDELGARGWQAKSWDTSIVVDDTARPSPTHEVDCYKNRVALELEWSNKDPFFDRDLNNFRLLFDLRTISVGVIITKSDDFRPLFQRLGIYKKYGASTTWMNKLLPRIEGGGGGGCPLLVFGITTACYDEST